MKYFDNTLRQKDGLEKIPWESNHGILPLSDRIPYYSLPGTEV